MRRISKTVETILGREPILFDAFARDYAKLFQIKANLNKYIHE